jgi:hypothetical protein
MAQALHDIPPTRVVELAVNLDDATGEVVGRASEALLAAGALDVWTTPITMKRGRPGVMLCVLAAEADRETLARRVLVETGSFGVRSRAWDRVVLDREWVAVTTRYGEARLKVGRLDGEVVSVKPEFADVERLAADAGVTVGEAMSAALAHADAWRAGASAEGGGG